VRFSESCKKSSESCGYYTSIRHILQGIELSLSVMRDEMRLSHARDIMCGEESMCMISLSILAIIPARGGSKGIPRKNLQPLAGKPLVAHTIEHARQARSVNRIVVSTDDSEIAAVSKQYGAEVIWRPAEISGDTAPSELALLHALDYLQRTEGSRKLRAGSSAVRCLW